MVKFAQAFPDASIVSTLSTQLSSSREHVELLQMHKDGGTVAEYWTDLPPNAEVKRQLHTALVEARERLARMDGCSCASDVSIKLAPNYRRCGIGDFSLS